MIITSPNRDIVVLRNNIILNAGIAVRAVVSIVRTAITPVLIHKNQRSEYYRAYI
jgi:hypothetical protein